jgi:hypothetical protein
VDDDELTQVRARSHVLRRQCSPLNHLPRRDQIRRRSSSSNASVTIDGLHSDIFSCSSWKMKVD